MKEDDLFSSRYSGKSEWAKLAARQVTEIAVKNVNSLEQTAQILNTGKILRLRVSIKVLQGECCDSD